MLWSYLEYLHFNYFPATILLEKDGTEQLGFIFKLNGLCFKFKKIINFCSKLGKMKKRTMIKLRRPKPLRMNKK